MIAECENCGILCLRQAGSVAWIASFQSFLSEAFVMRSNSNNLLERLSAATIDEKSFVRSLPTSDWRQQVSRFAIQESSGEFSHGRFPFPFTRLETKISLFPEKRFGKSLSAHIFADLFLDFQTFLFQSIRLNLRKRTENSMLSKIIRANMQWSGKGLSQV